MAHVWLDADRFAATASITRRAASKVLLASRSESSPFWRGASLVVREVRSRGGRSGIAYQVRLDSLPPELQEAWKVLQAPCESRLCHGPKAQWQREFWRDLLDPIASVGKHSRERGELISIAAGKRYFAASGKPFRVSVRNIQRKLENYEKSASVAVLGRTKRIDTGMRRTVLSRRWDAAVRADLTDAEMAEIAEKLRRHVRGLVAEGSGGKELKSFSAHKLADMTIAAGVKIARADAAFQLPDNVFQNERDYRQLYLYRKDRKAYEDTVRPRVKRSRQGLAPMAIVVGDVHPLDIVRLREDGSEVYGKAIAWLDVATNRIWMDILFLEKGKGIRNADVIQSFIRMCAAWGAPSALYLDNGSEYNFAEFVDDALKLVKDVQVGGAGAEDRVSQIVRARAYNAAAKPIEGIFGVLETNYFSGLDGWVGGDRTRKKITNVGRPPAPFLGTEDDLRGQIEGCLKRYHHSPQKGSLKGRSPVAVLKAAIDAGWRMTAIDEASFRVAFAVEKIVVVKQGRIRHGGQLWSCDELSAFVGDRVTILVPKFDQWNRLPLKDRDGQLLGFAAPVREYGFLEKAGAAASHRAARANIKGLHRLAKKADSVSRAEEGATVAAALPVYPVAPIGARLTLSPHATAIERAVSISDDDAFTERHRAKEEKQRRENAKRKAFHNRILRKPE